MANCWTCLFCKETFPTHEELTDHMYQVHEVDMADLRQIIRAEINRMRLLQLLAEERRLEEYNEAQEASKRSLYFGRQN